jgi:hypothetical protein
MMKTLEKMLAGAAFITLPFIYGCKSAVPKKPEAPKQVMVREAHEDYKKMCYKLGIVTASKNLHFKIVKC